MGEIILEPTSNGRRLNSVFLDGELMERCGVDTCNIVETTIEKVADYKGMEYLKNEGIFPVRVVGIDEPCTAYMWHGINDMFCTGLVVLNSDKDAVEWAEENFNNKSLYI